MHKFLHENAMIVVSITLPLLVVVFFALASVVPNLYSTPPAFDMLITHQGAAVSAESPVRIRLVVQDDTLKAPDGYVFLAVACGVYF